MSFQSAEISDINTTLPTEANAGAVQAPRFPKAVFVIPNSLAQVGHLDDVRARQKMKKAA